MKAAVTCSHTQGKSGQQMFTQRAPGPSSCKESTQQHSYPNVRKPETILTHRTSAIGPAKAGGGRNAVHRLVPDPLQSSVTGGYREGKITSRCIARPNA